jgi:hypothetical protein
MLMAIAQPMDKVLLLGGRLATLDKTVAQDVGNLILKLTIHRNSRWRGLNTPTSMVALKQRHMEHRMHLHRGREFKPDSNRVDNLQDLEGPNISGQHLRAQISLERYIGSAEQHLITNAE